jgi:hypothetical protein
LEAAGTKLGHTAETKASQEEHSWVFQTVVKNQNMKQVIQSRRGEGWNWSDTFSSMDSGKQTEDTIWIHPQKDH